MAAVPREARADDGWRTPDATQTAAAAPTTEPPATAEPPQPADVHFEVGGKLGYTTPPIRGGTTPFGLGFGGRIGLTFSDVYVGGSVVDYLGGSDVTLSDRALLFGVELGYGFRFTALSGNLTIRPLVGVGDAAVSHTDPSLAKVDVVTSASGASSSSDTITVSRIYVQPAVTTMFSTGSNFVALNTNLLVIPQIAYGGASEPTTWLSYGAQLELGFRF